MVFRDDRRRKDFFTDLLRFRKETATNIHVPVVAQPGDRPTPHPEVVSQGIETVQGKDWSDFARIIEVLVTIRICENS